MVPVLSIFRTTFRRLFPWMPLVLAAGCATPGAGTLHRIGIEPPVPRVVQAPSGPLTLENAITHTVLRSDRIASLQSAVDAATEACHVAGDWRDPELRFQYGRDTTSTERMLRPSPVSTAEDSGKYFTHTEEIPYMSVICYTRPEYRDRLPSITHVDGSARLQTLRKDQNAFLYATLKEFEKITGLPVILNTSFNPGGEPILNYYRVGLEMLEKTDLDMVLIENTICVAPARASLLDF